MTDRMGTATATSRRRRSAAAFAAGLMLCAGFVAASAPVAHGVPARASGPTGTQGTGYAPAPTRGHLDTQLDRAVAAHESKGSAVERSGVSATADPRPVARVRVAIYASPGRMRELKALVSRSGGGIKGMSGQLMMADVPVEGLVALSEADAVRSIFAPPKPEAQEITSEGVAEMNLDAWATADGGRDTLTGAGIKVGVVDEGFAGYKQLLGSELPRSSRVRVWRGSDAAGASDSFHGTGVAEIIHDVAPDAELYLAAVNDPIDLAQAVEWMLDNDVDVINMSMAWWAWSRVDGSGPINEPFDRAVAEGVACITSAGNYRMRHWGGKFAGPTEPRIVAHSWSSGTTENRFSIASTRTVEAWLWWDDWSDTTDDYNLQLVRWDQGEWRQVDISSDVQTETARPVESVTRTLAPGTYAWRIWRHWADFAKKDVEFDFFVVRGPEFTGTDPSQAFSTARSLLQPADNQAAGSLTAAAIGRAPGFRQERYSSEGPTIDGRDGVDFAAPASVASAAFGSKPFTGTSAAAPHVAGIAALALQAEPTLTPPELEEFLRAHTRDLGEAGPDPLFGAGRLWLDPLPKLAVSASPQVVGFLGSTRLSGLLSADGSAVGERDDVTVWRRFAGTSSWEQVAVATWSADDGVYLADVPLTATAWLQLRFPGATGLSPRYSPAVRVACRAELTALTVPQVIREDRPFVVRGVIRPGHSGGTRVSLYRVVKGSAVFVRSFAAKTEPLDETSSAYSAKVTVPSSGTWRVVATHADASHAKSKSPVRTFVVR